jgi:hypothetical protein
MANILLSWTSPSNITNVDTIQLFEIKKLSTDTDVATAPQCSDYVDSAGAVGSTATNITSALTGSDILVPVATSAGMSYVQEVLDVGEYYYAAFSKNSAGYSPCTVTTSPVSITTV